MSIDEKKPNLAAKQAKKARLTAVAPAEPAQVNRKSDPERAAARAARMADPAWAAARAARLADPNHAAIKAARLATAAKRKTAKANATAATGPAKALAADKPRAAKPRAAKGTRSLQRGEVPVAPPQLERKRLDFILAGTARSGTTAAAAYISAVREIHCANEVFPWRADHSKLIAPDCFFDKLPAFSPKQDKKFKKLSESAEDILSKADHIAYYGSKTPMYIYRLNEIMAEIGHPRAVITTRDLRPVATSYFRRSQEESDRFHNGRTGVFAAGDQLMLAYMLARSDADNVFIVPHKALTKDWKATISSAVNFVAPGLTFEFQQEPIDKIHKRYEIIKARPARDEASLTPYESDIVSEVEATGIDALLSRDVPFLLSDIQEELRGVVAKLPPLIDYIKAKVDNHPLPSTRTYYAEKWIGMANAGWKYISAGQVA